MSDILGEDAEYTDTLIIEGGVATLKDDSDTQDDLDVVSIDGGISDLVDALNREFPEGCEPKIIQFDVGQMVEGVTGECKLLVRSEVSNNEVTYVVQTLGDRSEVIDQNTGRPMVTLHSSNGKIAIKSFCIGGSEIIDTNSSECEIDNVEAPSEDLFLLGYKLKVKGDISLESFPIDENGKIKIIAHEKEINGVKTPYKGILDVYHGENFIGSLYPEYGEKQGELDTLNNSFMAVESLLDATSQKVVLSTADSRDTSDDFIPQTRGKSSTQGCSTVPAVPPKTDVGINSVYIGAAMVFALLLSKGSKKIQREVSGLIDIIKFGKNN